MRVLHVSSGNLYGGVEVLLATLARERTSCPSIEPHFALCFEGRLSKELAALGTPATIMGSVQTRFPWQVWSARRRFATFLREKNFDIIICHMAWAHAIFGPVARRAKSPLIFWLHDAAQGKHWIERWAARCRPDLVVSNSQHTAETLPNLFGNRSVPPYEVIYCPVSPPAHPLAPAECAELRASLDTPMDACVIIQVSRMEPYKGHALHLDALKDLAGLPGWVCWIVGGAQRPHEHEYLAKLQEQAARAGIEGRVRFVGDRNDVRRLLAAADIFCQPNIRPEAFGIVFIEALYARLPVVSTAHGGGMEIVDRTCGTLVPFDSPQPLAGALRQLLTDRGLREMLAHAGPAHASRLCAPAIALSKLESAFAKLLPGRGPLSEANCKQTRSPLSSALH